MGLDIVNLIMDCGKGLDGVNLEEIINLTKQDLPGDADQETIYKTAIYVCASHIEREPNYSKLASRILLNKINEECQIDTFRDYIKQGIEWGYLTQNLGKSFQLTQLSEVLEDKRNDLFSYLGLQVIYDRYLLRHEGKIIEKPQWFWMRVAMGLSLNEFNPTLIALTIYEQISRMNYLPSTPTLFNAGTTHPQLSSCYLSVMDDSIEGIFDGFKENAQLQKHSGGVANSWSRIRGSNSIVKGTGGRSSGVIPYLKVANDVCISVDQGGRRPGAVCAYLENWHIDIEEFLECRKNTGDERRRFQDMNTASWIPDLFMERVRTDDMWTLFSPDEVKDLPELYGAKFNNQYKQYEYAAEKGLIKSFKKVSAKALWRKMLSMLFETGHPWITFKDPSNIRYMGREWDTIHCSNLCSEITLPTSSESTAVCTLASINLSNHAQDGRVDWKKLNDTVQVAVRGLDNSIDINFYPSEKSKTHIDYRPLGLGMMGWQDLLFKMKVPFDSQQAIELADNVTEFISYTAIYYSVQLAKERGAYKNFRGSAWDAGKLPIDTIEWLNTSRSFPVEQDRSINVAAGESGWESLRREIKKYGIRNSCLMAIAPTATISLISNTYPCIEPAFKNLYVKSNASGDFTIINQYLVEDLKELGLWGKKLGKKLKQSNGSVQNIPEIPQNLKDLYKTAFEIDQKRLIDQASRRQKWIDQSQSLNLFFDNPSGKELSDTYFYTWDQGLKTTYYARTKGASNAGKVTVSEEEIPKTCSLEEVMAGCESCQ